MFGITLLGSHGLEAAPARCQNASRAHEDTMPREMSEGQRAYEAKRAAKAGMSLDKWLARKNRERAVEARAQSEAAKPAPAPKKPGLLSRLLDRAHKPL
jgi:hypothetical protein